MRRLAAALIVLALVVGCPVSEAQAPRWRGTGIVMAVLPAPSNLHSTRPVIVLTHDPIKGLMDERMTMPFIAASAELFRGLKAGDRVSFALADTPDALLVVTVERLAR